MGAVKIASRRGGEFGPLLRFGRRTEGLKRGGYVSRAIVLQPAYTRYNDSCTRKAIAPHVHADVRVCTCNVYISYVSTYI